MGAARHGLKDDVVAALALAVLLATVWAMRDWTRIAALRLPDTDDAMRLQQIRDWLAGQRFADMSQHRAGVGAGLAMHWSRLPDLVPAAMIAALTPFLGARPSEIAAVVVWPALLLGAALLLTARIARSLGGVALARTALIVAAIAYPATTLFLPGRIDHHGLQLVLVLVIVLLLLHPPNFARGLAAGAAAAASVAIGLETAPLLAVAGGVLAAEWVAARRAADDRLFGFGAGLTGGLLAALIVLRTDQWHYPACDGFTAITWRGSQCVALVPILLALGGRISARRDLRLAMLLAVAVAAALLVARVAPACFAPYGGVDPALARLWLAQVGEAQPLLGAAPGVAIGYAGLMVSGIAASLWRLWVTRHGGWGVLLAFQCAALALTLVQLRGAYAGAVLAAPALAAVIAHARSRGVVPLVAAWLVSAGMLYPLAAGALVPARPVSSETQSDSSCTSPEALAPLSRLPPGRLLAPPDLGAYAIGATRHAVFAAPYHRNNAGNATAYRFFLGSEAEARALVALHGVRYVAWCDGALGEIDFASEAAPDALAPRLSSDRALPAWLIPAGGDRAVRLFRVAQDDVPAIASDARKTS